MFTNYSAVGPAHTLLYISVILSNLTVGDETLILYLWNARITQCILEWTMLYRQCVDDNMDNVVQSMC